MEGEGENAYVSFSYGEECVVKPHAHTYADGVCSGCGYTCPHNGENEREASYFEKAICSLCHCEYGACPADTVAPTGEIIIKGRSWWQTVLNKISFGLFFKEDVSVIITATDDSYSQAGYDEATHAVKIEYFICNSILSEEEVKASSAFQEYSAPVSFSAEQSYVVYVRLTDHAGNVAYAGSKGFEIDRTAPAIEGMKNGGHYIFCGEKTITVTDKNIDTVTLDDAEISLDKNGQLALPCDSKQHTICVTDKAENETTVYISVYPSHDFDLETDTCRNCGTSAVAKVENGGISDRFANGDELFEALEGKKYSGATVTLLADATITDYAHLKNDVTMDLNGKKLQADVNSGITIDSGAATMLSSNGEGTCSVILALNGKDASLTMGKGIGDVKVILLARGKLTIDSGRYGMLDSLYVADDEADHICLYGGSFGSIYLKTALCRQILGKGYRFESVSLEDAGKTSMLKISVIPCDHANIGSGSICPDCGVEFFLSVEANGTTNLFETFEGAIRYAEQKDGCTVKLLQDLLLDYATTGSLVNSTDYIEITCGNYTLDPAGKTLTIGDWNNNFNALTVYDGCNVTVTDSVGGGKVKSVGAALEVRSEGRLTIERGDYTEFANVLASGSDSLTIQGGKFKQIASKESRNAVSPLTYLADGCAFMLSSGAYANESNVNSKCISGQGITY